jgi:hypothetical protein
MPQPREQEPGLNLEGLKTYVEGKAALYKLLFAVNGGAFAIATLKDNPLPVPALAVGAILFTVTLCVDMWRFSMKMRTLVEAGENHSAQMVLGPAGKWVLVMSGALIVLGWAYAAIA